jgi:hypothetical protein
MRAHRWQLRILASVVVLVSCSLAYAQDPALPFEPSHRSGASVTGAIEGWFPNDDGTFTILVGTYNRNLRDSVDIPIGPNNKIEPGGPDQGQPTHFRPGRSWGTLALKVPKDFGTKSFTWTLTNNGITTTIPLDLKTLYRVAPYVDANDNTPPYIGFSESGPFKSGPPLDNSESLTATVGTPLPLTVWVADADHPDALPGTPVSVRPGQEGKAKQPVTIQWDTYRGPAAVKFSNDKPDVEKIQLPSPPPNAKFDGKVSTTATFSQPGQYVVTVQAFNSTGFGGGGFQCCWSTAKVNVTVKPSTGNAE